MLPREVKTNDALSSHTVLDSSLKAERNGKKTTELTKASTSQQPDAVELQTPL